MSHPEFHIETILPGTKKLYRLALPLGGDLGSLEEQIALACHPLSSRTEIHPEITQWFENGTLCLPVLAAPGVDRGETLVATSGVHGDEYEGMEAMYRVKPLEMRGTLIGIPVATAPAFWLGVRCNPVVFPGAANASPTEQLADTLLERVFRHASLYVDLHSAGRNYHLLTLYGYCTAGGRQFGLPMLPTVSESVIWAHPSVSPGRTISAPLDLGIPSLYTEAFGGGGHTSPEDIELYTAGVV
jgi:predicted deacylase